MINGTSLFTPSSVAFSMSQSNRSPLGTAVAQAQAAGGHPIRDRLAEQVSSTRFLPPPPTRGRDAKPLPSKTSTTSPHPDPPDPGQVAGLVPLEDQPLLFNRGSGQKQRSAIGILRGEVESHAAHLTDRRERTRRARVVLTRSRRERVPEGRVRSSGFDEGNDPRPDSGNWPSQGGRPSVWKRHWKLTREPFPGGTPYISNRSHDEAVARLVDTIETGGRRVTVRAAAGLGKSSVLTRRLAVTRGPSRRQAKALVSPTDGASLFVGLAEGLGLRVAAGLGRSSSWRALCDAARLCRAQGLQVVLAVDGSQSLIESRRSARSGAVVQSRHASRRAIDRPRRGPALRR